MLSGCYSIIGWENTVVCISGDVIHTIYKAVHTTIGAISSGRRYTYCDQDGRMYSGGSWDECSRVYFLDSAYRYSVIYDLVSCLVY